MRGLSRAAVRLTIEAAFLALVAVGAVLAGFEPAVIVAVVAGAAVPVAVVERAYVRDAARSAASPPEEAPSEEIAAPGHAEVVDAPGAEPVAQPEPRKARTGCQRAQRAGDPRERTAADSQRPTAHPGPEPEPKPEPLPDTRPATLGNDLPYEWNVWDLQRLVRDRPDDDRRRSGRQSSCRCATSPGPTGRSARVRRAGARLVRRSARRRGARTEAAAAP